MAFTKRLIDVTFRLGGQQSFDTNSGLPANTVKAGGLRSEITITKAGAVGMPTLVARIYGLTKEIAAKVSTLGTVYGAVFNNQITVEAGDESGMTTVFTGIIDTAWTDYEEPAHPALEVRAHFGLLEQTKPLPPTSFKGSVDVVTLISSIAKQLGWQVENNGVSVQLRNQYLSGTGREQILTAARNANISVWMDSDRTGAPTVALWPQGATRACNPPLISKATGMEGYPAWEENALRVKTLFNPAISAGSSSSDGVMVGGTIQIVSSVPNASGTWQVYDVLHELDSNEPGGPWATTVHCINTQWPNPGDAVGLAS